ncbi:MULTISPECIES: LGFP repeat-containing protein [Nonomuraea]|uniref:LGFP repeat-containing protein n=1 Tax=Nonomuraea mangrovi TaxID=2316207 RepID=A0ABW4T0A5_9ACTN
MARSFLALAAAAMAAGAVLAAPGAAQAATARACDVHLVAPHGSLIGGLWRSSGAANSVYGCPATQEFGFPETLGSWQRFENGKIVWSPNVGDTALLRVFEKDGKMFFEWDDMGREWDFFNVRWSLDAELGNKSTDVRVKRVTGRSGRFSVTTGPAEDLGGASSRGRPAETWRFAVQGCDAGAQGSECGPWSIANVYAR